MVNTNETMDRPLDALNKAKNKRVIVQLKNNKEFVGTLRSFDIHINSVLEDAEEYDSSELRRKVGTIFIRGDMITTIIPSN